MIPAKALRVVALCAWLTLVVSLVLWYRDNATFALAFTLPLLFPLPGLWRGRRYTYQWCSLLVLFYLGLGLVEAIAVPPDRVYAYVELGASALLFVSCLLYARFGRDRPDGFAGDAK